jgi:hypothetical protein
MAASSSNTAQCMLTGAPEGGERQQRGEMLFREGDQILHQYALGGGPTTLWHYADPVPRSTGAPPPTSRS